MSFAIDHCLFGSIQAQQGSYCEVDFPGDRFAIGRDGGSDRDENAGIDLRWLAAGKAFFADGNEALFS